MKKVVVLAMLLTVGMSFGQNETVLKQFKNIESDYKITEDNKILYERVIETKHSAKQNYDQLLEVLTEYSQKNVFKNILPNSDLTKITLDGQTGYFSDHGYFVVKTMFNVIINIKDNKVKFSIYPNNYVVNDRLSSKKITEEYPFAEKNIELKKVKRKNNKLSRFTHTNNEINELVWRIDDKLSEQKKIIF